MAFDSNRPVNSGDTKLSEIAVDRTIPFVTGSAVNGNGLVTQEIAFRAITELVRRSNYILRSEGFIAWDGTNIRFDSLTQINSINLEILGTEGLINTSMQLRMQGNLAGPPSPVFTANATSASKVLTGVSSFTDISIGQTLTGTFIPPGAWIESFNIGAATITMNLAATGGAPTLTTVTATNPGNGPITYQFLPIADGELLYLELDSTQLVDQGLSFNIQNAVNGGGTQVGMRLLKVPMTTAMPKLQIGLTGGGSIFYIPLALRRGTQLWWIPHGIMWPAGTISTLGAVIVSGVQPWPNFFVNSQAALQAAVSQATVNGGGVILVIDQTVNITTPITIPPNTILLGRGMGINKITVSNGGQLILSSFASIEHCFIEASAGFTGVMISTNGTRARIEKSNLKFDLPTNVATNIAVQANASEGRFIGNQVQGVIGASLRIGFDYTPPGFVGACNIDVDTIFI